MIRLVLVLQEIIFAGNCSTSEISTNQRRVSKKTVLQQGGTDCAPSLVRIILCCYISHAEMT